MLRRYTAVFGVLALALSCGEPCFSTTYNITDIGVLPGSTVSVAYGVNASGVVVGYSGANTGGGSPYAFVWTSAGGMTNLGALYTQNNSGLSYATGVNAAGNVVGFPKPLSGHAFLYNGSAMNDLYNISGGVTYHEAIQSYSGGALSMIFGKGIAINDNGDMVGHYAGGSGDFYWKNGGSSIDIGNLGGSNSTAGATGINNSDVVVGNSQGASVGPTESPWVWTSTGGLKQLFDTAPAGIALGIDNSNNIVGQIGTGTASTNYAFIANSTGGTVPFATSCVDLGMLSGDASSLAWSVANGNVVGQSVNSSGTGRAVLWAGGTPAGIVDLNKVIPAGTGWDLTCAYGVSSTGYIVGVGTLGGVTQAFLLTPAATPEPSALLLAATGMVGLLAYAWRKRK
jgi:probable HAF family extracellular repeat protein